MTDVRAGEGWPALRVDDWEPTRRSLHMWTQIVGKVRLAHAPLLNHWWQVPLYVSPRGLTTSAIPVGTDSFDMEFDFVDHALKVRVSDGGAATIDLRDTSVAQFHEAVLDTLGSLGIEARISNGPNEVDPAIPFAEDTHVGYDPAAANAFWRQLVQADRVINQFRARFIGKVSPVHFFWGSFDLACTRFSGRPRTPASRRRAELRRLGDGGGVLPRAEQLRILARRRGRGRVLLLRLSRTGRVRRRRRTFPTAPSTTPGCGSTCCPTRWHARRRTPTRR